MEDNDQEGMSTGKKALAGAAVGIAVPAAVTVAKKLIGNGDDEGEQQEGQEGGPQQSQRGPQQSQRASGARRSSGGSSRSGRSSAPGSKSRSRAASSRSGSKSSSASSSGSSGSKSRSSSRRSRSRSSSAGTQSGSTRTKEQLYNQAKRLNIPGRSSMSKQQLERAIARKRS